MPELPHLGESIWEEDIVAQALDQVQGAWLIFIYWGLELDVLIGSSSDATPNIETHKPSLSLISCCVATTYMFTSSSATVADRFEVSLHTVSQPVAD